MVAVSPTIRGVVRSADAAATEANLRSGLGKGHSLADERARRRRRSISPTRPYFPGSVPPPWTNRQRRVPFSNDWRA